jgi:hypothetical protein
MCDTILGRKEFCDFQGRGKQAKAFFAENQQLLASSRTLIFRYQR